MRYLAATNHHRTKINIHTNEKVIPHSYIPHIQPQALFHVQDRDPHNLYRNRRRRHIRRPVGRPHTVRRLRCMSQPRRSQPVGQSIEVFLIEVWRRLQPRTDTAMHCHAHLKPLDARSLRLWCYVHVPLGTLGWNSSMDRSMAGCQSVSYAKGSDGSVSLRIKFCPLRRRPIHFFFYF